MRLLGMSRALASALILAAALPWSAAAQPATVASSQITITPNAGAYSAGQCLGGVLAMPNLVRSHGPGGANLTGIAFVDPAHQTAANDAQTILVFNVQPTGTYTDHANCQLAANDIPLLVGTVSIAAANCVQDQGPTNTICTVTPALAVPPPVAVYSRATNNTTAAGAFVLNFAAVPAYIKAGMLVADTTTAGVVPNGATVTATSSTTVTISKAATGAGVGNGDTITFTQTSPTIATTLWFVPIVVATPTYGANNLTFTFLTTPFGN